MQGKCRSLIVASSFLLATGGGCEATKPVYRFGWWKAETRSASRAMFRLMAWPSNNSHSRPWS